MWNHVSLVRNLSALATAINVLQDIHNWCPSLKTTGVQDAACTGEGVAVASVANHKLAGTHHVVLDAEADNCNHGNNEEEAISV